MNAVLNRIGVAVCFSLLFWGCTHDEGTVYKTSEVDSEEDADVEDLGGSPSSKIFRIHAVFVLQFLHHA